MSSAVQGGRTAEAEALRGAARQWSTGVALVTVQDGEELFAKTVSSFCVLSLEPPLVSVAIDRRSPLVRAARGSGSYAVSILNSRQEQVARRFATPGAGRALGPFTGVPMRAAESGAPVLEHCLAWFDCRLDGVLPGGDHAVLVGRVLSADPGGGEPLLYHDGGYRLLDHSPHAPTGAP
ncbi:flavin reductase family protein [Streptacidiphilus albus]|jgi:flavin reductase (DIM6/NTAB) family NADH-FMN oxidoreductase RutF|uniref:flavin reductase family protein n=1 Tax=Streptacidiphilus albus TaxID=105425 RepID=UPI00068A54DD|nr:flavin reductase family protein [Streptacidiphilus albus]